MEKRERDIMNTKIVQTPGWISNRRESEREKRDHEHKDSTNKMKDGQERCRKRRRDTVDGAALWPNRRVVHNTNTIHRSKI